MLVFALGFSNVLAISSALSHARPSGNRYPVKLQHLARAFYMPFRARVSLEHARCKLMLVDQKRVVGSHELDW
jgi:hypothetical protein